MPQFTQWTLPDPSPNILFNPMAVDAAIAKTQSELGGLDIERQKFGLEKAKFDRGVTEGEGYIGGSLSGTAETAGASGATVGPLADAAPDQSRDAAGQASYNFWVGKGLAPHMAAGMAAQEIAESGGRPHVVGDGGDAIGLYQHHAPRRQLILAKTGIDMTKPDANAQREGAYWELMNAEHGARKLLFAAKDADEAGRAATEFERPDSKRRAIIDAERGRDARRIFQLANPNGAAGVATASVDPRAGPRVGLTPPPAVATVAPPTAPGVNPNAAVQIPPPAVDPNARVEADDPNTAAVKQAATALLNMPEPDAAAAYPAVVRELQARGFAMNAPPTYPGHAALQALVGEGEEPAPPPVDASRQAARLGGTNVAGPPGVVPAPPDPAPNRMAYGTGLPGVTIGLPTNGLAPSPTAVAPSPVQTAAAPPTATRPPPEAPPPAPSRAIQREPLLSNNLTASQQDAARRAIRAGTPLATVQAHVEQWKQENVAARHQDAVDAAAQQQQDYERRLKADETQYTRGRQAEIDQRSKDEAARHAEELAIKQAAEKRAAAKDEADQKARVKGDAIAAQHENTLLEGTESGETNTAKYASAYSKFAEGRYNADGSFVKPTMSAYAKPTFIPPGATEVPDYGKQDTPGPLPPPAIMTGMQGNVSGIKNINQVLRELDAHPNSVGMKALQGEWALQYTDPEGIALRAGIADILSQTFHERSGASVTISESPRLKPFVPAPTDTVAALRTKLERLRGIYREVLEDNYSVYGPEGTGRSLPIIERTLKQTPKASDKTDAATVKPPPKGSKVIIP
jgi:hypothetical protein